MKVRKLDVPLKMAEAASKDFAEIREKEVATKAASKQARQEKEKNKRKLADLHEEEHLLRCQGQEGWCTLQHTFQVQGPAP